VEIGVGERAVAASKEVRLATLSKGQATREVEALVKGARLGAVSRKGETRGLHRAAVSPEEAASKEETPVSPKGRPVLEAKEARAPERPKATGLGQGVSSKVETQALRVRALAATRLETLALRVNLAVGISRVEMPARRKEAKLASKAPSAVKMGTMACHLATHRWAVRSRASNKAEWEIRMATPECRRATQGCPKGRHKETASSATSSRAEDKANPRIKVRRAMCRKAARGTRKATRKSGASLLESRPGILRAMAVKEAILDKDSETRARVSKGQRIIEGARTKPQRMAGERATKMAEQSRQEKGGIAEAEDRGPAPGQQELCPVSCRLRQQTPVSASRPCASSEAARWVDSRLHGANQHGIGMRMSSGCCHLVQKPARPWLSGSFRRGKTK
jgi:hypothetical protein